MPVRSIFCAAILLMSGTVANAAVITSVTPSTTTSPNGLMSTYAGVTTVTFNGSTALPAGFSGGVVVQSNSLNQFSTPNGDTSNYYAVGSGPSYTGTATFTPGGAFTYFGLYWGSIDLYNSISFSLNGSVVASYSGADFPPSNGNQTSPNTNEYVNFLFNGGSSYDKVTFNTSTANFEMDNVAYGNVATSVPEPASLAVLGLGLAGLAALRRRRAE